MSAGRIVAIVSGAIAALIAIGLLGAAGTLFWVTTQRDDDGYYSSRYERFGSPGYAVRSDDLDLGTEGPDWLFEEGRLATIRLRGRNREPHALFLGIGPKQDVERYLRGVPHDVVRDVDLDPFRVSYRHEAGTRRPPPPASQPFWAAQGRGAVTWEVEQGNWVAVAMNADAVPGISADISVAAKSDLVLWSAIVLLVLGLLVGGLAALLLVVGTRGAPAPLAPTAAEPVADEAYPLRFEGELEEGLSRWLWLVKWLLLIPHLIVLAFLWAALVITTIVAFFAILFTERYPRSLFGFAVGVLRWTWRVSWYGYGGLGTDRYPPFTLGDADYPARLDVPYPERLSRGLVLVKWWLLAIPHYVVISFFLGGGAWWWRHDLPGLIPILVLFAAVVLLFRGSYPRSLYTLVLGMDRWVARVAVYALLLRDEYPPFRLDR
jgi:hypothetical protein